jgi:diguanylate cyclase (GGDEF)-like protein
LGIEDLQVLQQHFLRELPKRLERLGSVLAKGAAESDLFHQEVEMFVGDCNLCGLRDLADQARFFQALSPPFWDQEVFEQQLGRVYKVSEAILLLSASTGKKLIAQGGDGELLVSVLVEDEAAVSELCSQLRLYRYEPDISTRPVSYLPPAGTFTVIAALSLMEQHPELCRVLQNDSIPWVAISKDGSLASRLKAVKLGSSGFFVEPVNPSKMVVLLDRWMKPTSQEPFRILIYEGDPLVSEYFSVHLEQAGLNTRCAEGAEDVLEQLFDWRPDLLLLDLHSAGCRGEDLASVIRQQDEFLGIPIVFLSNSSTQDQEFDAIRAGGDEFLSKNVRLNHLVDMIQTRAARARQLRSLSEKDSLTGLLNHTRIKERLSVEVSRAHREKSELAFVMLDIDHFKSVNDSYGHLVGDQVIQGLARLLRDRFRLTDSVGRYGGEEFAVVMPGCSEEDALTIFESLREQFAQLLFRHEGTEFHSTFSAGIALLDPEQTAEALNDEADQALYCAKRNGRNRLWMSTSRDGQSQ